MAPFNTHFLIAEKIWPELDGPWQPFYEQFCFGCIAPDVDKLVNTLTQKDTHFFDRTGDYELMASHRSAAFIKHQADFLSRPFNQLSGQAQAFAMGYLCHLCVDEVSKHMWRRETWLKFKGIGPGPAFAALDEVARQRTQDYAAIVGAFGSVKVLDVVPVIPLTCLERILEGVSAFTQAGNTEGEYLALLDLFDILTPEKRRQKQHNFQSLIEVARRQVDFFRLDSLVEASLIRSHRRLADLRTGRIPEPDYPEFD